MPRHLVTVAAGAALLAVLASGCGDLAGAPASSPQACGTAAYAAVRRHAHITALPASCRGLGPDELGQAIRIAVVMLAPHGDKAQRRHLAGQARTHLAYLIGVAARLTAARAATRAARRAAGSPPAASRPGPPVPHLPVDVGALIAWLLTAGTGTFLAVRRLAHGPPRQGLGQAALVGHAGLALTGLATWTLYLVTGWVPLAWAALVALLPVAGLGMATLLAAPDPRPATAAPAPPALARRGPPVIVIAGHGALATATLLLALLAAVAAVMPR